MSSAAQAQVAYAPDAQFYPFGIPVDESYGLSRSFEIYPGPYGGAPAVGVVYRCQYPHGWNVTDFARDVNGTPAGLDHSCVLAHPSRVRARY
jgi:hypothetical protein